MSHHTPRLVTNDARSVSSNLVHGVKLTTDTVDARALAALSLSSVWSLSAEVEGRAYGGGVLKLETREAEKLLVPVLRGDQQQALINRFARLDQLMRAGERDKASAEVDDQLGIDREPP